MFAAQGPTPLATCLRPHSGAQIALEEQTLSHLLIKRTRSNAMIIGQVCSVASSISESRAEVPESELQQSCDAMSRPASDFLERMGMMRVAVLVFAPGRH